MDDRTRRILGLLLTTKQFKAMKIIDKFQVRYERSCTAKEFATHMWPNSTGWRRHLKTGRGVARGKGMWLCAGSFLSKMIKEDLIRKTEEAGHSACFILTNSGRVKLYKDEMEKKALAAKATRKRKRRRRNSK